jgi:hypothetical protein
VRHSSLLDKVSFLPIPDHIYNWIASYLENRSHCTRFNDSVSQNNPITVSVVQGSAIGPFSFLITASDLYPHSPYNKLFKFADDMYLIVPISNAASVTKELLHIADWAKHNNLKLNNAKSTEVVFSKKRTKVQQPPLTPGLIRANNIIILGVHVDNNLSMQLHVQDVLSSCSPSLYA